MGHSRVCKVLLGGPLKIREYLRRKLGGVPAPRPINVDVADAARLTALGKRRGSVSVFAGHRLGKSASLEQIRYWLLTKSPEEVRKLLEVLDD